MLGRLHVITETGSAVPYLLCRAIASRAGADVTIQVRVKGWTDRDLLELAEQVAAWCRPYGAACIVNDRVDVALAAGADGVHLGAEDLPVSVARRLLGPDALVGGMAGDPATARALVAAGASYLGVGPCFATVTKAGLPDPIGLAGVAAVAAAADVPIIAIGGVRADQIAELRGPSAPTGWRWWTRFREPRTKAAAVRELLRELVSTP